MSVPTKFLDQDEIAHRLTVVLCNSVNQCATRTMLSSLIWMPGEYHVHLNRITQAWPLVEAKVAEYKRINKKKALFLNRPIMKMWEYTAAVSDKPWHAWITELRRHREIINRELKALGEWTGQNGQSTLRTLQHCGDRELEILAELTASDYETSVYAYKRRAQRIADAELEVMKKMWAMPYISTGFSSLNP